MSGFLSKRERERKSSNRARDTHTAHETLRSIQYNENRSSSCMGDATDVAPNIHKHINIAYGARA